MDEASMALADVRGWLCDHLSDGDAGEVCGMLSVVSRHIVRLEDENLRLMTELDASIRAIEDLHDARLEDVLLKAEKENDRLRGLVRMLWFLAHKERTALRYGESPDDAYLEVIDDGFDTAMRDMRELGIDAK